MKKTVNITVLIVVLVLCARGRAGTGVVMNGSFENDGWINDIRTEPPYRWCDVSVPSGKFSGWVSDDTDWLTHGDYYLILSSYPYATFGINDTATVSQEVYLTDVNEIIFNVKLDTTYDDPWDPSERTAVLSIDGYPVWESNSVGSDVRGEYYDQVYIVEEEYKDAGSHRLSLGIRVNAAGYTYINYLAKWDVVRFDSHCGGFGYLPEDFDGDCYIDGVDSAMLVEQWLVEGPNAKYDLFGDGIINFDDYALFTDYWMANSDSSNWRDDNCYQAELPATDLNGDGIVNFIDYALLTDAWMEEAPEGTCFRVDGLDLGLFVDEWLERGWFYGL
ncbi:MAG: hypothetical protein JSV99_03865 [Planctomycetota bacterium]|nr:MAG: hypothetical protein JSV99_03865 [Planctomycetota bacterium]